MKCVCEAMNRQKSALTTTLNLRVGRRRRRRRPSSSESGCRVPAALDSLHNTRATDRPRR